MVTLYYIFLISLISDHEELNQALRKDIFDDRGNEKLYISVSAPNNIRVL
jgi:hypothetical protein